MEHLARKRHADEEDLKHAVIDWLNSQAAVWYKEGINKLVSRYDNIQGVMKVKVCHKNCIIFFFPIVNILQNVLYFLDAPRTFTI